VSRKPAATYLGATALPGGRCLFRVWAPYAERVDVRIEGRLVPLAPAGNGYHEIVVEDVAPGARYRFRLDEEQAEYPDPASRHQPEGVHGPSEVVSRDFEWTDGGFRGRPLRDLVLYEIHVGTFTEKGTFEAAVEELDGLCDLGVTALELMPVAAFPGERNWGYDGVFPYAVQSSYGGPSGLKRLVDECHRRLIAVSLDVVYNHLGPEGNVLGRFGPYFTDRYRTPWGPALNFDGPGSDEVRRFYMENALYWLEEFHIDQLRLDAVHAICDLSPRTFLEELQSSVQERFPERRVHLIPESASNDVRLVRARELGGYGLDAVWNDDFHHALRTLLTEEREGYYQDYGTLAHLEKSMREGFAYSGEYSSFRRRRHGTSSRDVPATRFVVFAQNHDQIGNRARGDRLIETTSLERVKLAAAVVLLSPYLPLLFMGEEYGERAPFPYFVSHSDPALIEAVRRGRKEELARFGWTEEPPDPQAEETFRSAVLRRERDPGVEGFYRELLRLRRELTPLSHRSKEHMKVVGHERERAIELHYWTSRSGVPAQIVALFHFGDEPVLIDVELLRGTWHRRLDSAAREWRGQGSTTLEHLRTDGTAVFTLPPWSAALYEWAPRGGTT
jgi:maltooligosyltrehalose trehalohydrolase